MTYPLIINPYPCQWPGGNRFGYPVIPQYTAAIGQGPNNIAPGVPGGQPITADPNSGVFTPPNAPPQFIGPPGGPFTYNPVPAFLGPTGPAPAPAFQPAGVGPMGPPSDPMAVIYGSLQDIYNQLALLRRELSAAWAYLGDPPNVDRPFTSP